MELTRSVVMAKAAEYADEEALFTVEDQQIETLPAAFASGDFGWRDAEWVVRWYYRRYLGAYPDDRRRAGEDAFGRNDYVAVRSAIEAAAAADDDAAALSALTALDGVDVPVGSAFLQFLDPVRYLVVGDREWTVLEAAGELDSPYPDPPGVEAYRTYVASARALAADLDCDLWTLYRALWRLYHEL